MLNINFNFDLDGLTSSCAYSMSRREIEERVTSTYKSYTRSLFYTIEKVTSNKYEQEILRSIVEVTINEFLGGLVRHFEKNGYSTTECLDKIRNHAKKMEEKIQKNLATVAKDLAGINYHITKG